VPIDPDKLEPLVQPQGELHQRLQKAMRRFPALPPGFWLYIQATQSSSCCAEEDRLWEGSEDPRQVIPEVILKAKQSDSLLSDSFF